VDNRKQRFKDDIEAAERNILIYSWIGIFVTVTFIAYTFKGLM
jgi:hypothetical protein